MPGVSSENTLKGNIKLKFESSDYLCFLFILLFGPEKLFCMPISAACICSGPSPFLDLCLSFCSGWQTLQCDCLASHGSPTSYGLKSHQSLQCSQCFPRLLHSHLKFKLGMMSNSFSDIANTCEILLSISLYRKLCLV
jgi:hypothetical protein